MWFICLPSVFRHLSFRRVMAKAKESTSFMTLESSWRRGHISRIRRISGDLRTPLKTISESISRAMFICNENRRETKCIKFHFKTMYMIKISFTCSLIHDIFSSCSKAWLAASRSTVKVPAFNGGPLKPTTIKVNECDWSELNVSFLT